MNSNVCKLRPKIKHETTDCIIHWLYVSIWRYFWLTSVWTDLSQFACLGTACFPLILCQTAQTLSSYHEVHEWKASHVLPQIMDWVEVQTLSWLLQHGVFVVLKLFLQSFGWDAACFSCSVFLLLNLVDPSQATQGLLQGCILTAW